MLGVSQTNTRTKAQILADKVKKYYSTCPGTASPIIIGILNLVLKNNYSGFGDNYQLSIAKSYQYNFDKVGGVQLLYNRYIRKSAIVVFGIVVSTVNNFQLYQNLMKVAKYVDVAAFRQFKANFSDLFIVVVKLVGIQGRALSPYRFQLVRRRDIAIRSLPPKQRMPNFASQYIRFSKDNQNFQYENSIVRLIGAMDWQETIPLKGEGIARLSTLKEYILREFDIYRQYQRRINSKPNYSQIRNIIYGLSN